MDLYNAQWQKSTRSSGGGNGDCVEVAGLQGSVSVRDSKDTAGPVLLFGQEAWSGFVNSLKDSKPIA
ncbi:DUF397 domain-containing protein [Micromonospora rubida]